jgi:S-formylglutathione hydrolase FrmB
MTIESICIYFEIFAFFRSLVSFLRNSNKYKSCSAFAPICNPINCPWGLKAFTSYLGSNTDTWKAYDATELVSTFSGNSAPILIDQGLEDNFLKQNQLLPENFKTAVNTHKKNDIELVLNYREVSFYQIPSNIINEFVVLALIYLRATIILIILLQRS